MGMLRRDEVQRRLAMGRTALDERMTAGLLPPWIRLGPRVLALQESEVAAILAAQAAQATDAQLRVLAERLVGERKARFAELGLPAVHDAEAQVTPVGQSPTLGRAAEKARPAAVAGA